MKWMIIALLMLSTVYAENIISLDKQPNIKCADFLDYLENGAKNDIVVIHRNRKLHISLVWDEWWNIGISDDKLEWRRYIGFLVEINNGFILHDNRKFTKNQLDDFIKHIKMKSKEKNICIAVKFNEKMKDEFFINTWVFLHAIHQLAHDRVAYIRFDVPEEDAQEPPSCPSPEETAHQILSNG